MRFAWGGALALACALALAGCSALSAPVSSPSPTPDGGSDAIEQEAEETPAPAYPEGAVSWTEALEHVGSDAVICGPVIAVFTAVDSEGQSTFLNLGADHPDPSRFTAIIFEDYIGNFSETPASYEGAEICVTGTVRLYNEQVEIEVQSPSQITAVG